MESQQRKGCSMLKKDKKIFILNITILHCLSLLLFMNFWATDQEDYMKNYQIFLHLLTAKNLLHITSPIKHGTVSLDKLPQLTKNAKLTVLRFIFQFSKMFRKLFFPSFPKKKDGKPSISPGSILFKEESKVLNTMTLNMINGFKLISVLHMPS